MWSARKPRPGGQGPLISAVAHAALLLLTLFVPTLSVVAPPDNGAEVRLVHLKGGGEMLPGWIKPTQARPDDAPVPDGRPQAAPEPAAEPEGVALREQAEEKPPAPAADEERAEQVEQPPAEREPAADTDTQPAEGETGAGVGRKPGPEGEGLGATSDTEFAGESAYLSRIEAEVQRRFNFRGNAPGKVAEYHFTIDRNGEMHELILMVSSGVSSLDLSARSALMRAKFPPLPRTFPHNRLGVTFRFFGD